MAKEIGDRPGRKRAASGAQGNREPVRAVLRALRLLDCFTTERPDIALTEFARDTGLPVSTVSRLLDSLETASIVRRAADGRYACGTRLMRIGLAAVHSVSLYEIAGPHLEALVQATRETANLGILAGPGVATYLRQVLSPRAIRYMVWLGRTLPTESTALGMALCGTVGPDGYVIRQGAVEPDVTAVAAPVYDVAGAIVGALTVTGPSSRVDDATAMRFGRLVAAHAAQASASLGFLALPAHGRPSSS
jgi:urocanate hydratase